MVCAIQQEMVHVHVHVYTKRIIIHVSHLISLFYTGVLCQSFSPPTGEICPGDNVTFTCVVLDSATRWTVTPGGDGGECAYFSSSRTPDMCGPGDRFTSSQTDVNGDINNSSLSVDSITADLNGTLVECADVGSYNICIVGKNTRCMYTCTNI